MNTRLKILYLLGCNEGPSKRYRVFNHIEYLSRLGVKSEWIWDLHPEANSEQYLSQFSIVVNFRGGFTNRTENLLKICQKLNIPTVYDIDDLVFDPSLADQMDVYRTMPPAAKAEYLAGMKSISSTLLLFDYATTSTPFLQDYISRYSGRPAYLIPFGLNEKQIKLFKVTQRERPPARFIGYLSGTQTHEKDFSEAAGALSRILREYDDVYLKLVGPLDIDKHLPGLHSKIVRIPFIHWESLVFETASLYATIAPFNPDSPFCQAKSDLKFVEPASCRVPTIASPISSFEAAIRHGENGFIARREEDWYRAFKFLLDDPASRDLLGNAAYEDVMRERHPDQIGEILVKTYQDIINKHPKPTNSTGNVPLGQETSQ